MVRSRSGPPQPDRGTAQWRAVSSRLRLAVMVVAGVMAAVLFGLLWAWAYAPLAGWDVAALVFSGWVWATTASMGPAVTAAHATREDPGRAETDLIVLIAAVASLAAVGLVLIQASSATGGRQDLLVALGVVSVGFSWFAVHTLFALKYARLYYAGQPGGIDFNQKDLPPRYLDFAYLAFTIGMTFQVSDTDLKTPAIRATALRQALLAYLFGTVILGATINLIAGLVSSSKG
jgi:uncharacterized membrane protein